MLRTILPTVLDIKCQNIYREERSVAKSVAEEVIGTQAVGVWDFFMPIIFFVNLFKHKRKKEAFILNLMFTRKLALEAVRGMVAGDLTREAALEGAGVATSRVLAADNKGIYPDRVRQKQMKEIELLIGHYHRLVMSAGKTYADMLKAAYPDRPVYLEYLRQVSRAEQEVNRAALQTVGKNPSAHDFVDRMERALEQIRKQDADKYYPAEDGA